MEKQKDTFTPEQHVAIDAQGRTIVSASAGSGKTTVMIEKIIRFIQDGGSVSSILAVTFTKKAASQMKEKLRKALIKKINEKGVAATERERLKVELDNVQAADISTIHSFCARLIRTHFYKTNIDNTFRIIGSDDAEAVVLKNEAMDRLFEEGYDKKIDGFERLISAYWRKKSDSSLREYLVDAYDTLMNRDDYLEYLDRSASYNDATFDQICDDLLKILQSKVAYYLDLIENERIYFTNKKLSEAQFKLSTELIEWLEEINSKKTYFDACSVIKPKFTRNSEKKNTPADDLLHKDILGSLKDKVVEGIYEDIIKPTKDEKTERAKFMIAAQTAVALSNALRRFDELYTALKRERNVLDYNDLEHVALRLLGYEDVVNDLRNKYKYVFVDEYQDVNPVQDAIISKISGANVFLVGDVKQSIYGFRGSKSKFFVDKRKELANAGQNDLMMRKNFRSADAVLDAVNTQFALAMTPDVCSVDYAREGIMEKGGLYAQGSGRVCVHFLPDEKKEKTPPRLYSVKSKTAKEKTDMAQAARLIKEIIDKELRQTYEEPGKPPRPIRYADICVLTRKKKKKELTETITALAGEGLPITSASAVNICEYAEIKTLTDILSLIDNANQDVPLCSALLSPMGNLTADDLTDIRLAYPSTRENSLAFRTACQRYAKEKNDAVAFKLRSFYAYFERVRNLSTMLSAGELLAQIITDTRMEAGLLSKDNSEACLRRINRFIEETNVDGPLSVHEFLNRLRGLDNEILYSENGGENAVKVVTMHSSKGLEYPVVILNDLSATFRGADHDEVLLEEKYGIAPRAFVESTMTKNNTVHRLLCKLKQLESSVADELNLYYVAMTRAQESLHLIFKERTLYADVKYAKSFADFTNFSVWEKYIVEDELLDIPKQESGDYVFYPDEDKVRDIERAFTWEYEHTGYENLPVKSSATQLMLAREEQPYVPIEEDKDEAEEGRNDKTSVEQGLAYHAFLERLDFARLFQADGTFISDEQLRDLIGELCESYRNTLGLDWVVHLDEDKLMRILKCPIFERLQGKELYKEQSFLVSLPVKDTYARYGQDGFGKDDEEMIFQGAIDLLAIGQDEAWVIDYKDSIKDAETLKQHYAPQLELYRMTVAKIAKKPIEKVRCFIVNLHRCFQTEL